MLDIGALLWYYYVMNTLKLKPLSEYNGGNLNNHQVAIRGRVSYPTAVKYLRDEIEEPGLIYVIRILDGLGVNWRTVTLGDLVAEVRE